MTPSDLKALRAQRGWTQAALAAKLGVTRNAVTLWEMGARKISDPMAQLITLLTRRGRTKQKGSLHADDRRTL